MNTKILLYQIGYFILAALISTLIFYKISNGFRIDDLVSIIILTVIIYVVIYYSMQYFYKSREDFVENFATSEQRKNQVMNNLRSQNPGRGLPMMPIDNSQMMSADTSPKTTTPVTTNNATQMMPSSGSTKIPSSGSPMNRKNLRFNILGENNNQNTSFTVPIPINYANTLPQNEVYEEIIEEVIEEVIEEPVYQEPQQVQQDVSFAQTAQAMLTPDMQTATVQAPPKEVVYTQPQSQEAPPEVRRSITPPPRVESGMDGKGAPVDEYPQPSKKKFQDKKMKDASRMQDGTDINKYRLDDGSDLVNKNQDSTSPININVSYNNNRPTSINDFDGHSPNANLLAQFTELLRMAGGNNLDKYQFSSGMEKKQENCMSPGLLNPVNKVTQNAALSSLNQNYYPSYLQNPLNKEQQGTQIKSIFEKNRATQEELVRESKTGEDRKNLIRKDKNRDNNWMQSNYEATMLRNILSEKNDPAPVILESPWSQWAPTN